MKRGKSFEHLINKWLKDLDIYHERFLDARSVGGFTAPRPADYFVYKDNQLYYLELKSVQTFRLPFNNLSQLKKLVEVSKYGIISYFIIKFKESQIYAIRAEELKKYAEKVIQETSSISVQDASKIGIKISSKDDLIVLFNS